MFESNRKMAVSGSIPSRLTGRVAIFQRVYNRGVYRVTLAVNGAVKASITNTKTKAGQTTQLNFDLKPVPVASKRRAEKGKAHGLGASEYGKPYRRSMGRRSRWQRRARHVERAES